MSNPEEAEMHRKKELDLMYQAIDEEGRDFVFAVLRGEFERVSESAVPARLRLVFCRDACADLSKHQVNSPSVVGAG